MSENEDSSKTIDDGDSGSDVEAGVKDEVEEVKADKVSGKKRERPQKEKKEPKPKEPKPKKEKAPKVPKEPKEPKPKKEPKPPKEKGSKKKVAESDGDAEEAGAEPSEPKKEAKKRGKKGDKNEEGGEANANGEKKAAAKKSEKKPLLDPEFNLERDYFYQEIAQEEWGQIKHILESFYNNTANLTSTIESLGSHSNLKKSPDNLSHFQSLLQDVRNSQHTQSNFYENDTNLNKYILSEFYTHKPAVLECHFFPNEANEVHVVNMLRKCKHTLDVAIFTLTNDRIHAAIEEAFNRGVKVRIIADDECSNMGGSDVHRLASIGVPVKMDDNKKVHMHHKVAIIDNSVLVTGSFNWTSQAVKENQENILFYENREICQRYTNEYNRLWEEFTNVVTKEMGLKRVEEDEKKKKAFFANKGKAKK